MSRFYTVDFELDDEEICRSSGLTNFKEAKNLGSIPPFDGRGDQKLGMSTSSDVFQNRVAGKQWTSSVVSWFSREPVPRAVIPVWRLAVCDSAGEHDLDYLFGAPPTGSGDE